MHHHPVANRARTRRIVRGHSAERRTARRRRIDREEQTFALQPRIEMIENESRLNAHAARRRIKRFDRAQIFAGVDDDSVPDRLSALRGSGAAR